MYRSFVSHSKQLCFLRETLYAQTLWHHLVMSSQSVIFLSPDLHSKLIIKQRDLEQLRFYCYSKDEYNIELWSNLTPQKQWASFPFIKQQDQYHEFQLIINTLHLAPDDYEYTLRYATKANSKSGNWTWYGLPNENGSVRIVKSSTDSAPLAAPSFATAPQLRLEAKEHTEIASLWHFKSQSTSASCFSIGQPDPPLNHYVALLRKGSCWLTPVSGIVDFRNRPSTEQWQFMLYQDNEQGNVHLWMVVGDECWMSPNQEGNTLMIHQTCKSAAHLLVVSAYENNDFTSLIEIALNYYKSSITWQKDYSSQNTPYDKTMLDKLGYCTWNSFGKSVDFMKVEAALKSLESNKIPVSYLLLDDGWQNVSDDDRLLSFESCKKKFPVGLKQTVFELKQKYSFIQYIGVWHALWGYWSGIDENFAKKNNYTPRQINCSGQQDILLPVGLVDDPKKFYNDFYQVLNLAGVDFVKVDVQGRFQDLELSSSKWTSIKLWDTYRNAMIKSANDYLHGRVVHCMSLTPHILLHPILSQQNTSIFRNSDDFFPDEKNSHSWHIYTNTINSLWTNHYPAIGDWDMFQSAHPFAEYHASSRAISGGPIYLTDLPNKHNVALIYKLIAETKHDGYTILRSYQSPLPTFETVFGSPMENQSTIGLYNLHSEESSTAGDHKERVTKDKYDYVIYGFWNVSEHHERIAVVKNNLFFSKKFAKASVIAYVLTGPDYGKLVHLYSDDICFERKESLIIPETDSTILPATATLPRRKPFSRVCSTDSGNECQLRIALSVRVSPFSSSMVSISHIQSKGLFSAACLGLIDKFNSTRAIMYTEITLLHKSIYYATLKACLSHRSATCGFWIKHKVTHWDRDIFFIPEKVLLDDQELINEHDWIWCSETGLLTVNMMSTHLNNSGSDLFCIQIQIMQVLHQ